MNQREALNLQIASIKALPPLPENSVKIMTAVNDPDVSVNELVEVISQSAVLTARLLGLANSAYFGRSGEIIDLRVAIIQVLGLNLVKSLSLSIVLNVELDTSKCQLFDAEYFWSHSLITAVIAQKLAQHLDDEMLTPNIVYTSGLLLNIGLTAAVYIMPEEINEVFSRVEKTESGVSNQMLSMVGMTHYDIGAMLLARWKLPETYQIVISKFRSTEFNGKERGLIKLLQLSHLIGSYVVNDKYEDLPEVMASIDTLSMPESLIESVVTEMASKNENIRGLAALISG